MYVARPPDASSNIAPVPAVLTCPACQALLNHGFGTARPHNTGLNWDTHCPKCRTALAVVRFPALQRPTTVANSRSALQGDEATCFYHEEKQAETSCSVCGRFVCGLCGIEMGGVDVCPECVGNDTMRRKHLDATASRRTNHGRLVLLLCIIPFFAGFSALLTFPISIGVAIRSRGRPRALATRTVLPMVSGLILGALQLIATLVFIYFLATE